jgi:hypothetical protein
MAIVAKGQTSRHEDWWHLTLAPLRLPEGAASLQYRMIRQTVRGDSSHQHCPAVHFKDLAGDESRMLGT